MVQSSSATTEFLIQRRTCSSLCPLPHVWIKKRQACIIFEAAANKNLVFLRAILCHCLTIEDVRPTGDNSIMNWRCLCTRVLWVSGLCSGHGLSGPIVSPCPPVLTEVTVEQGAKAVGLGTDISAWCFGSKITRCWIYCHYCYVGI